MRGGQNLTPLSSARVNMRLLYTRRYNEEMQIFTFFNPKFLQNSSCHLYQSPRLRQAAAKTANSCPDSPAETAGLKNFPQ